MYLPAGGNWRTHFGAFRFDTCGTPTFTTAGDNLTQGVCASSATPVALDPITINVNARNGFTDPVTMSFEPGLPAGFSGDYTVNPVNPPGTTVANLAVDNTATPGANSFVLRGTSGAIERDLTLDVNVSTAIAPAPNLTAPANGATNVPAQPTFTWDAATQAASYLIEIATDAGFNDVILSQTVTTTTFQPSAALPLNTEIWWRVTANNDCGSTVSTVFSFTTQPGPGQCGTGSTTQVLLDDNVESGANGWTHDSAVGTDTWTISGSRPFDGASSWKAVDPSSIADQRLTSPVVTLPADLTGLNFQFEQWRLIEGSGSTCADGGILEVALDGGVFSQVPSNQILVGGYEGTVSSGSGNPLAGNPAWCGLATAYEPVIVDISSYAGHDAQFRFRLGSNNTAPREGWYIDTIKVQGCSEGGPPLDRIFADGFDGTPPP
jgi:hypothetical protein